MVLPEDPSEGSSPSGEVVAVMGTRGNRLCALNISSFRTVFEAQGARGELWAMDIHPIEANIVLTAGHGRTLMALDLLGERPCQGETRHVIVPHAPQSMSVSPDGAHVAVGCSGVEMKGSKLPVLPPSPYVYESSRPLHPKA